MADSGTGRQSDLSQKTVVVLVILTVLISVFGTFAVLDASSSIKTTAKQAGPAETQGKVTLNILSSEQLSNEKSAGSSTGRVALEILPPEQK